MINIFLFMVVPKGFFPEQDTGRIYGNIQAAQDISFQAMEKKLLQIVDMIKAGPGCGLRDRLHRRRGRGRFHHQHRPDVHLSEAV